MSTTWHTRTQLQPKSWLLANGEVVQEPELEETTSGRKVRIKGTTLSCFSRDVDDLIFDGVSTLAKRKQTTVWMALANREVKEQQSAGYNTAGVRAPKLHFLHGRNGSGQATTYWWRFKHQSLPIEAVVTVKITTQYGQNAAKLQQVDGFITFPSTATSDAKDTPWVTENTPAFSNLVNRLSNYDHQLALREFVRDNPPSWKTDVVLGSERVPTERKGVEKVLKRVRAVDEVDAIQIPDLRDPADPRWLNLELFDTNVHDESIDTLREYMEGAPSIETAAEHYGQMLKALRSIGMVFEAKGENDFLAALLAGDKDAMTVNVGHPAGEGHSADTQHKLTLHLTTGTFIVTCSASSVAKNEIAEKWEEAITLASLTGQEDELLAYARRYAETQGDRRITKILDERKGEDA